MQGCVGIGIGIAGEGWGEVSEGERGVRVGRERVERNGKGCDRLLGTNQFLERVSFLRKRGKGEEGGEGGGD